MTKRTREIAFALQKAGLAGMPNLVKLAEWIEAYVARAEVDADRRGRRQAYLEVATRADSRYDLRERSDWQKFAHAQLDELEDAANFDRMEGSGT